MKNLLLFAAIVLTVQAVSAQDVIDIAEARTMAEGEIVTVTGTVTNGEELGPIRYFQDATGAFAAYSNDFTGAVARHDSITLTGEISFFNGLMQVSPVSDFTNHGPAVVQIEPVTVTLGEVGDDTEALLIRVENCVFADGGSTFTGNSTYSISSGAAEGIAYTRNGNPLVGSLIPVSSVDIVAIGSQFTFTGTGGYQILPRDEDDITSPNPVNIISAVTVSDLTANGFTISWVTDVATSTEAFYTDNIDGDGLTDNVTTQAESVTQHALVLDNLEPGEVYFTRIFSVAEPDTAFSTVFAVATISNSSGTIEAFFNASVAHEVAEPAENLAEQTNLRDKVIEMIEAAQTSISMAGYNINDNQIVSALNAAHANGITVRYIAEDGNANFALDNISPDIPVHYRYNATGSGMHNKFVIVDAQSINNSYVLTGSTNFTNNNLFTDPNNMVVIQDRALAKAYTIEFNEMWGGSGPMFDEEASRFGPDKSNNTPSLFKIGGKDVELYFSPSDGTNSAIINALETTDASVEFSLLV
ncbi:MAG: phospholipase D-like domain-containing protein, partial [Flavobacteriales bacterium]|nr:phospholipase D-like domain-containing protein [Flavobacteriales bacterium]